MTVNVEFDEKVAKLAGGGAAGMSVQDPTALTVQTALMQVGRTYPSLHLFNCEGELRSSIKLTRNGQPVTVTDPLADGDTLRMAI